MKLKDCILAVLCAVAAFSQTSRAALQAPLPEFKSKQDLQARAASRQACKEEASESTFYTGKPFEANRDGYLFKHRSYSADLNRWASVDPSGFPDGTNNFLYAVNTPTTGYDKNGFRVQWIEEEDHYSQNETYEALPAATFTWSISHNGTALEGASGSFTGTFQELYNHSSSVGFVTWRGLGPSDFGSARTLSLWSRDNSGNWYENGWTVTAGFLENAYASPSEISNVNQRLNPIGAETSLGTLRGLSTYLYSTLLSNGSGYNGDLFYE